jgi:hypothetical protein
MELVKVKMIAQAITARYGTLSVGDTLRTDMAFAKHLVEDCKAAEFEVAPAAEEIAPQAVGLSETEIKREIETAVEPVTTEAARVMPSEFVELPDQPPAEEVAAPVAEKKPKSKSK